MTDRTDRPLLPGAGACLVSRNVLSGAGRVRWMVREFSQVAADNGWRIFSEVDTEDYLHDAANLEVVDFNRVCEIEPALLGIWDLPVGSDLELVRDGGRLSLVDTATGAPVPLDDLHVPAPHRGSWRDTTSEQAQDDLDELLDVVLTFADEQVARAGALAPFGASVGTDGAAALAAADPTSAGSETVLAVLRDGFRSRAGALRAVAVVADVRTADSDAVRVELEHREGTCLVVLQPYSRSRLRKKVTFGAMSVSVGERHTWA